jgi:hypothetical protein
LLRRIAAHGSPARTAMQPKELRRDELRVSAKVL